MPNYFERKYVLLVSNFDANDLKRSDDISLLPSPPIISDTLYAILGRRRHYLYIAEVKPLRLQ